MGAKYELRYGEIHPTIKRAEKFISGLSDEQYEKVEKVIREGMAEDQREEQLLWITFNRIRKSKSVTPTSLMYLVWYMKEIL